MKVLCSLSFKKVGESSRFFFERVGAKKKLCKKKAP